MKLRLNLNIVETNYVLSKFVFVIKAKVIQHNLV